MRYDIKRGAEIIASQLLLEGTVSEKIMGEEIANITFSHTSKIEFHIGDKITIYGKDYFLSADPSTVKKNTREFQYTMIFFSIKYALSNWNVFFYDNDGLLTIPEFSIMGTASTCLDIVITNANRADSGWAKGVVDDTEVKNITFSDFNCLEAISKIAEEFKLEYWIDSNKSIHFTERKPVSGYSFEYGKAKGLKDITRSVLEGGTLVTRLYVKGSDKNLPKNYRGGQKNLRIDVPCLEKNIDIYGVKEHTETFSDIYPKRVGTVTAVDPADPNRFSDAEIDFDLNAYNEYGTTVLMNGVTAKIIFQTGQLAGYRIELIETGGFNSATKTFYLNPVKDEKDMQVPSELLRPAVGDTYIIEDIMMPEAYVLLAESDVKIKGQEYLDQNSKERFQYASESDMLYFRNQNINIQLGYTVHFKDEDFNLDDDIRVTGLQKNIQNPYDVKFDLSEVTVVSSIVQSYYEQQEQTTTILNSIKYNAELARRNYLFGREFHDKVFDGEDYFNAENIKPLSIETKMLSLGSRLQQFGLPGVNFKLQNNNALQNTGGKIVHQTIDQNAIREWNIASNTVIGISNNFNYIFIKCQKVGSNANFVVTEAQIKVEQDPDFYHFEVGYLSSVLDGYRKIKTTFGFAQLNPAELSIGRISDPTGNNYIDLLPDRIAINAKIEFAGDSPAFQQINDSIKIGGRNLIADTSKMSGHPNLVAEKYLGLSVIKKTKIGVYDDTYWAKSISELTGTEYVVSFYAKSDAAMAISCFFYNPNTTIKGISNQGAISNSADGGIEISVTTEWKRYWIKYTQTSTNSRKDIILGRLSQDGTVYLAGVKLEKGNKESDWTPAPEDIDSQISEISGSVTSVTNLVNDITSDGKLVPNEKHRLKGELDVIIAENSTLIDQATPYGVPTVQFLNAYNNLNNYLSALLVNLNSTSDVNGDVLRAVFTTYYNEKTNLLKAVSSAALGVTNQIRVEIDGVYDTLDAFENEINTTFADGIISKAEAISIEKYLNQIRTEKSDITSRYNSILVNSKLSGSPRTNLINGWSNYDNYQSNLEYWINIAIADGKTTAAEKANVDSSFVDYRNALSSLSTRFEEALFAIDKANIDDIRIGGRNLLLKSNKQNIVPLYGMTADYVNMIDNTLPSGYYFKYTNIVRTIQDYSFYIPLGSVGVFSESIVGKELIISFLIRTNSPQFIREDGIFTGVHISNEWTKVFYKISAYGGGSNLHLIISGDNFTELNISSVMIEKGNKASDWTAAPEDIKEEINEVYYAINDLESYVGGSFQDGIIEASEANAIEKYINQINTEKADVESNFVFLYNSESLKEPNKSYLLTNWNSYNSSHANLINVINGAIAGGTSTPLDKANVNTAFADYRAKLGALSTSFQDANKSIEKQNIKGINISARNLFLNSSRTFYAEPDVYGMGGYQINEPLVVGEEYTLYVKSGNSQTQNIKAFIDGYQFIGDLNMVDGGFTEIVFTAASVAPNRTNLLFYNFTRTAGTAIYWATLVKGNKALKDFIPAPEDVQAEINLASQNSANALAQAQNAQTTANKAAAVTNFMQTTVDGNVVSTGTLQVGDVLGANAGITGVTDRPNGESVRFYAGSTYAGKNTANWLMKDNGVEEQWFNGVMIRRRGVVGNDYYDETYNMNGTLAKRMAIVNGKAIEEWYADGILKYQIGANGIYYVTEIPESYEAENFCKIPIYAELYTDIEMQNLIRQKMQQKMSDATWFKLSQLDTLYFYNEGVNAASDVNRTYRGYKNSNSKTHTAGDGWYAKADYPMRTNTNGTKRNVTLYFMQSGVAVIQRLFEVETYNKIFVTY